MLSLNNRIGKFSEWFIFLILFISLFSQTVLGPDNQANTLVPPGQIKNSQTQNTTTQRSEQITFTNVTPSVGLSGVRSNFFAWGDYNNDNNEDLLVSGGRLFQNTGAPGYEFKEVTSSVGLSGSGNGAWADYDNDGNLDFYCAGSDILWHNEGPPNYSFSDVTDRAGNIRDDYPTTAVGWGDYDLDGYLDLYIANGEDWNDGNPIYYPDFLYHNNGDGTFKDVTASSGIRDFGGPYYGRGVAWGDYDNDGWPDVYISNYRISQNWLFENNRNGTFTDVALEKGVAGEESQRLGTTYYGHTVGSAWADLDNDGYFDLFESDLAHKDLYRGPICGDSQVYKNDGPVWDYSFTDVRTDSDIPEKNIGGGEDELFVGIAIADFDNDGHQDLFIPQIYDLEYSYSYLYQSNGDLTYTNVSNEAGVLVWNTYGGAWCDYNNDGFLDLVTGGKGSANPNATYEVHLYKNNGNKNSWLKIKLVGKHCNKFGIGVRVEVTANGGTQVREVEGGMGCHSMQNSIPLEFGFGEYTGNVTVDVLWPTGYVQRLEEVELNQQIVIDEPSQEPDLGIYGYSYTDRYPIQGETFQMTIYIINWGYITAEHAVVRFYDGEPPAKEIVEAQELFNITSFEFTFVEMYWNTTGQAGEHDIWIVIEDVTPEDVYTENNYIIFEIEVREKNEVPIATLTAAPLKDLLPGDKILFDGANSSDDIWVDYYYFDFGDGKSTDWITVPSVEHIYDQPGVYTASLTVKDNEDEISTNSAQIEIIINAPPPPNRAPVVDSLTAEPMELSPGESTRLKVKAHDPDDDEMKYFFNTTSGTLSTKEYKPTAIWEAPDQEGTFTVTVRVGDGELFSDFEYINIKVKIKKIQYPPDIIEITTKPIEIYPEDIVTINVEAMDPNEEDELTYHYETTGGNIIGSGAEVSWLAPKEPKIYFIAVEVTDSDGLSTEQEISLLVNEQDHSPVILEADSSQDNLVNNKPTSILFTAAIVDLNGLYDIQRVEIDLSSIDGSRTQKMYDNGKHGDLQADDGIYSYEYLAPEGVVGGNKIIEVFVTDYTGNSASYDIELFVETRESSETSEPNLLPAFEIQISIISILCIILLLFRIRKKNNK